MKISTSFFNNKTFKIIIILLFPIVIISSLIIYQNITYKNFLVKFESSFNNFEFSQANNLILTEEKYNIFKVISLDKDLTSFFNDKITEVTDSLNNNSISDNEATALLNEISRYKLNSDDVTTCFSLIKGNPLSQDTYLKGLKAYEDKNYEVAITQLSKVPSSSINYGNTLKYLKLSKQDFKPTILTKADDLAKSDYYSKALDYLKSFDETFPNDPDIASKKDEIQKAKDIYLAKTKSQNPSSSPASSSTIINSITTSNINTLNIPSYTSYLIYVSLDDQKTYVYTGRQNKWNLKKTITCSTGITGKDTPQGVYEIGERNEWFFSEKFNQGGKYWLQFYGNDYLFHSLPFKKDKKTVDDWTLGKKASHGCIRLPIEDSKWLYDTIPRGTKVVIK